MKTIIELLTQTPIYLHDWSDKLGLIKDFEGLTWLDDNDPKIEEARQKYIKYNILFASYTYADYRGDAFVLFEQDGKLYEVNGGHCSCYGLEDQFTPEETTLESIKHRLLEGTLGVDDYLGNLFASELKLFLGI